MDDDHSDEPPKTYVSQITVTIDGNAQEQSPERTVSMRRVKRGHIGQAKPVLLVDNNKRLQYHTCGFCNIIRPKTKTVKIDELVEVRSGFGTDRLQKAAKKVAFRQFATEEKCVSLIVQKHRKKKHKTIDFIAESPDDKEAFVTTLQSVIDNEHAKQSDFNEKQWVVGKFHAADVDSDGKLNFHEVWRLLKEMNLSVSHDYAKLLFMSVDAEKSNSGSLQDGRLDEEEFLRFFLKLTFEFEVGKIMRLYSSDRNETLSAADLKNFLVEEQQFKGIDNNVAASIIDEIIIKQGNYRVEKSNNLLGPVGFRTLLHSRWGNILRSGHEKVFQDMNQPLSHYYVNSSHNTYLMGIQVKGEATMEGYINAIKKGARLIEHVLDGTYGEPCITHRGTLVASMLLKDALHAIKNYAFKYSPYPLILTIENHCNIPQQQAMARTFVEVLGDDIYVVPENKPLAELPSPNELKYKYLLRGKSRSTTPNGNGIEEEREDDDEVPSPTQPENPDIDPMLSKLISLSQMKLTRNLRDENEKHPANGTVSISETKVQKLAERSEPFTAYTSKHFVKSYPKGLRQDSSNLYPIQSWIVGIQSAALNMQTRDENMDLNSGLFRINGNCGYVLKPTVLVNGLDPARIANSVKLIMTLVVISGEYLPKPSSKNGEIIDPYVTAEICGIPADCIKFRTKVIGDNGFNPVWNEVFKFELRSPETALLRLCVKDYDTTSANDFIGEFSVPVTSIRPGYSIVSLYTGYHRILDPSAALVIHVNFEEIQKL